MSSLVKDCDIWKPTVVKTIFKMHKALSCIEITCNDLAVNEGGICLLEPLITDTRAMARTLLQIFILCFFPLLAYKSKS